MLKLYGGARSRASIVQWYLEELGVPYEYVLLDMQAGQHKEPEYLAINPFGKVPGIEENGYRLWESGAILLYLSEKYDTSLTTLEQRATIPSELRSALIAQWVLFANATLGPGVFVEATRDREMPRLLAPLNQILDQQPFLLGDRFSAADVAVGSMLAYMPLMLKIGFDDYPAIADYLKRIAERPAFQKTIGGRKAA